MYSQEVASNGDFLMPMLKIVVDICLHKCSIMESSIYEERLGRK